MDAWRRVRRFPGLSHSVEHLSIRGWQRLQSQLLTPLYSASKVRAISSRWTLLIRRLVDWNVRVSRDFDLLLPTDYVVDGNSDFKNRFAAEWLTSHIRVVDVGGGKTPFISPEKKRQL